MVNFGGWDMPVEYPCPGGGLIAEHMAVRTGVGLFDVSHMGEIQFRGPGSLAAVQHITMNDAARSSRMARRTTPPCSRPRAPSSTTSSCTASAPTTICSLSTRAPRIKTSPGSTARLAVGRGFIWATTPAYYSQLALQGPRSLETLAKLTKLDLAAIKNYWFTWGTVAGIPECDRSPAPATPAKTASRSTFLPTKPPPVKMWNALLDAGAEFGIRPCGLGARNTLRLEAGMSLYGHEISEDINVFEAGLTRWLKLDKGDFIGRDALLAVQAAKADPSAKSSASKWSSAASPATRIRCHSLEGEPIGVITSGSPAPFSENQHRHGARALGRRRIERRRSRRCARQPRPRQTGPAPLLQAPEKSLNRILDLAL
jgi:aminomethyltransferase